MAPARRRRGESDGVGGSPGGVRVAPRKYHVIDDDEEDDDEEEDGDESYDEAEAAQETSADADGRPMTRRKTPPKRPPAPNFDASFSSTSATRTSSFSDAFFPPKMESLDLFTDPDILGLIGGGSEGGVKCEEAAQLSPQVRTHGTFFFRH